jgi:hypothetical protein
MSKSAANFEPAQPLRYSTSIQPLGVNANIIRWYLGVPIKKAQQVVLHASLEGSKLVSTYHSPARANWASAMKIILRVVAV